MKATTVFAGILVLALSGAGAAAGKSVLFVGNSFLFGSGSAVRFYRADTVTDLNNEGIGGVPALFKSFTQQAGLDYDVSLETRGGSGLDFHLKEKLTEIGSKPWDTVVMHGFSLLDAAQPRDPAKLIATSKQMADFLRGKNPAAEIYLISTWARADNVYPDKGAWHGKSVEDMTRDVRAAYDQAAKGASIKRIIPVGESWLRAMKTGVADQNPYDGIEAGKLNLWTYDSYHASTHGYYLQALVIFGTLTGKDPRSLGDAECSAFELGMSRTEVRSLQQVAFDEVAASMTITPAPKVTAKPAAAQRCAAPHSH
jgi:hypothetical protein